MKEAHGEVLTEHIAHPNLLTDLEKDKPDELIYQEDIAWLKASDFVVAEVTQTSLGVGYELGYACAIGKPVLALWRPQEGKVLSAMIGGDPGITSYSYQGVEEAYQRIDEFVRALEEGDR